MKHELDGLVREIAMAAIGCGLHPTEALDVAATILAAGYRKPRTITTAEELDALPKKSVALDNEGDLFWRLPGGWFGIVDEDNYSPWLTEGTPASEMDLPAVVLWEPEA